MLPAAVLLNRWLCLAAKITVGLIAVLAERAESANGAVRDSSMEVWLLDSWVFSCFLDVTSAAVAGKVDFRVCGCWGR